MMSDTIIHDGEKPNIVFTYYYHHGGFEETRFDIVKCDFKRNQGGHLKFHMAELSTNDVVRVFTIKDSAFALSSGNGFEIECDRGHSRIKVVLIKSNFSDNKKSGLYLENTNFAEITDCLFTNNKGGIMAASSNIMISKSNFSGNKGEHDEYNCSVIHIFGGYNSIMSDVTITDNGCTGIIAFHSILKLENLIILMRNHGEQGGALVLSESILLLNQSTQLIIINNTADTYGGGIYIDSPEKTFGGKCFYQFEDGYSPIDSKVFTFSGNRAVRGGDMVFGGGLSNCSIRVNGTKILMNKCDPNNTFWKLISLTNVVSQSTFVDYPRRVVFCENTTSLGKHVLCDDSYSISVYRGQIFTVPLMVADDCCFPSVELIEAIVVGGNAEEAPLRLEQNTIQRGRKWCHKFSYTLVDGLGQKGAATIQFSTQQQYFLKIPVSTLRVKLEHCPLGYEISEESGKCGCQDILKEYEIECDPSNLSFAIPAQTWVGEMRGVIAVQKNCQYCRIEGTQMVTNITNDSHKLCIPKRTDVMCGACLSSYSLQLGGYECADCSNSAYKGVLLLMAFLVLGIALVLLLLSLNLTVSTGMINGLIFYSNIVYLNSDALLPTTIESNNTHLLNTVRILSTFQAWVNLDFGIVTCFFEGYNTYISTWMQFVFPLYIWLLVLIIVLASRYSRRISKITTSNTVPVLSTLLLLSYAKLLKTSIEVFSPVHLQLLDGSVTSYRWAADANILYLSHTHWPLFLMSVVMVVVYVIPFTVLISLGPLLQAKSHYRRLNWVNKLKPFFDSFYGPYTSRYRYWPGVLLLARLVGLATYNNILAVVAVSIMVAMLPVIWLLIGRTQAVSIHRNHYVNYFELFFLLNLGTFTVISYYIVQFKITHKQGLAVVMVGSALGVSCGILGYHIFLVVSRYSAISRFLPRNIVKRKDHPGESQSPVQEQEGANTTTTTHSLVEMAECVNHNDELREPLLTSKVRES
jgi:hypothetical protein